MRTVDQVEVQEDIPHQDLIQDEENCLLPKEQQSQEAPATERKSRLSAVKRLKFHSYFMQKVLQMKRPEFLLIVITLILTIAWFEIICIVKHDHDQMKLKQLQISQKELSHPSFIEIPHSSIINGGKQMNEDGDVELNIQAKGLKNKKSAKKHHKLNWDKLQMKTSLLDTKEYKLLKLENELKVLLISDKDASQSAASMDVRIGSWSDPKEIAGLAHFLEHMKFIATNEYTKEPNSFDNYLSNNQGSSNAYTDAIHTNYHYDVSSAAFDESLKLFSYMFNKSQFNRDFVMKEINAVNSEFVNTLTNDRWKVQYLAAILSKTDHPASSFSCGSNETLISDEFDILEKLDEFDKSNYSANLMSLVVYSNQSVDELTDLVYKSDFHKIPNFNRKLPKYATLPIDKDNLGKIYKLKMLKSEQKSVFIYVQIENSVFEERKDYVDYLNSILNNSEEGGFYQKMKEKNLISFSEFGIFQRTNESTQLMFQFDLTENGYQNMDEFFRSFYIFMNEFKTNLSADNYDSKKNFEKILFKYSSNDSVNEESVSDFASIINYTPRPDHLFLLSTYNDLDLDQFNDFLDHFCNPKEHLIFITSMDFDGEQKINSRIIESIDNTFSQEASYVDLSYDLIATLTDEQVTYLTSYDKNEESSDSTNFNFLFTLNLELAPKGKISFYNAQKDDSELIAQKVHFNTLQETDEEFQFISSSKEEYSGDPFQRSDLKNVNRFAFTIPNWKKQLVDQNKDNQYLPIMLVETDNIKSFIMINADRNEPLTLSKFRLVNKNAGILSKENQIFNQVFLFTQMRNLEDKYAAAFVSKYSFSISTSESDVQISTSGWNQHFKTVMKELIVNLKEYEPTQSEWDIAVENSIIEIQTSKSENQLFMHLTRQLMPSFMDNSFMLYDEKIELLQKSKLSDIETYKKNLFTVTNIDALYTGNVSPLKAIEYTDQIQKLFEITNVLPDQKPSPVAKILNLGEKSYVYQIKNWNSDDQNSAILNLYQIGERTVKSFIYLNLLSNKMDRFFFNYLRTQRTLGYVAGAKAMTMGCVDHIGIVLQGDKKQPNEINRIIEKGLKQFSKELNQIDEKEFEEMAMSFQTTLETLPPSLDEKFDYMWIQMVREKYDFDIRYYYLNALQNDITLKGMKEFFFTYFRDHASKLSLQIYSLAQPFDAADLDDKTYSKNLKKPILVSSKEDITNLNQEKPYYECSFTL